MALKVRPGISAVGRAVEPAARAAALQTPGRALDLIKRGKHNVGIVRIDTEVNGAGFVVLVKNFVPRLAAVDGAINPAVWIRAIRVTERRDQHMVRVARIDP